MINNKNIWFEVGIHLFIMLAIIPATIFACLITIKSMLFAYPEYVYNAYASRFYNWK